jgi:NADH-quinone oxidoreductase subunit K
MIPLNHYLVLGALLFALSVVGIFLNRKNLIVLLMAIELMLLAVNMNFIAFAHYNGDLSGQVFVFFILTVGGSRIRDRPRNPGGALQEPSLDQRG